MSNSRVMFVSAMSLILGLQSGQIKSIDSRMQSLSVRHAIEMEAQSASKAGIASALGSLRRSDRANTVAANLTHGKFQYTITKYYTWSGTLQARIVSTGEQKGVQYQTVAIAEGGGRRHNRWHIVSIYTAPISSSSL